MNNHLESNNAKVDFFLGDLEQRAQEQNVMFALYKQGKQAHGIRLDLNNQTHLINAGEIELSGVKLSFDNSTKEAFINGTPVDVKPLFKGLENSTEFDYNKQRKIYLEDTIKFQAMYIDFDSKGSTDIFGNEHNTAFNEKKIANALFELQPDYENINPNNFFKTEMTATQKIRLMSSQIDAIKSDVKKISHKLAVAENKAIKQPLVDKQLAQSVKDILSGAIDPMEATKRDNAHEIDADHHYVRNILKSTEGLNNTNNFAISHLKPMPKDYETQQTLLRKATAITYDDNESNISIIAKQLSAFSQAKDVITNAPPVDFANGTDLERLFVSTKRMAGSEIIDGKSCVMDANEKYRNVNAGDFGLPRSSLLTKPIGSYSAIALAIGASAAGAISTALKHRDDVLVIDALREDNVNRVLFDIRKNHHLPIAVFTSNKDLNEFLLSSKDRDLTLSLSKDKGWGEIGIDAIRADKFDDFTNIVESKINQSLSGEQPKKSNPVIRASLNTDALAASASIDHKLDPNPTNPTNYHNQMGL